MISPGEDLRQCIHFSILEAVLNLIGFWEIVDDIQNNISWHHMIGYFRQDKELLKPGSPVTKSDMHKLKSFR